MQELLTKLIPNVMDRLPTFFEAIGDTLLMVVWSGAISFVLGLALGVLITVTKPGGILENKVAYQILDKVISLFRSIPFIILLTWVMPVLVPSWAQPFMSRVPSFPWCSGRSPSLPGKSRGPWRNWTPDSSKPRWPWVPAPGRSSSGYI